MTKSVSYAILPRMDVCSILTSVLSASTIAATGVAASAWLAKRSLDHAFDRKIEAVRAEQRTALENVKSDHAKDMRRLESDYRRVEGLMSRWDERQADAIQQVVSRLAALMRACAKAFDEPDSAERLKAGWTALGDLIEEKNRTSIFFDDELLDRVSAADHHAWEVLNHLKNRQDPDVSGETRRQVAEFRGRSYELAYGALVGLGNLIRQDLRTHFQRILQGQGGGGPVGVLTAYEGTGDRAVESVGEATDADDSA